MKIWESPRLRHIRKTVMDQEISEAIPIDVWKRREKIEGTSRGTLRSFPATRMKPGRLKGANSARANDRIGHFLAAGRKILKPAKVRLPRSAIQKRKVRHRTQRFANRKKFTIGGEHWQYKEQSSGCKSVSHQSLQITNTPLMDLQ